MPRTRKQSARVTLRNKYKVEKKVRDHHKKLKKAARITPRRTLKKDPGIPNLWPFKESMLLKINKNREEKKEQDEKDKERKKKLQDKKKKLQSTQLVELAKLHMDIQRRNTEFTEKEESKTAAQAALDDGTKALNKVAMSGVSKRAYYREFRKVIEAADVIIEVLDARDPLGCRCPEIEKTIMSADKDKKIVLLLNKIDLVPKEVVEPWLKYLRADLPTLAFKASTQQQRTNLGSSSRGPADQASEHDLRSSECIGADTLVQLLKNYCRSVDIKKSITVGIIGYPNVGKSSVINSLKRSKVVGVGATAGLTRTSQEIHLDRHIKLMDCPGIIFASDQLDADIILRNAVRIEQLDDPVTPVDTIIKRCKKERLMETYQIPSFNTTEEFLAQIAKKRGKLKKGGKPQFDVVARLVLQDWNSGKISFFTMPPARLDVIDSINQANNPDFVVDDSRDLAALQTTFSGKSFITMESGSFGTFSKAKYASAGGEEEADEEESEEDEDESDEEMAVAPSTSAAKPKAQTKRMAAVPVANAGAYNFNEDWSGESESEGEAEGEDDEEEGDDVMEAEDDDAEDDD